MAGETYIRLLFFLGFLSSIGFAEVLWPRRKLSSSKTIRWKHNVALVAIDSVAARMIMPVMPIGMAEICAARQWGILNNVAIDRNITFIAAILLLDLIIYFQHLIFHATPLFWRFHQMHHTDLDLDVSTGNRFHPVEIIISLAIKIIAVLLTGPSVQAVLWFEIILNASSQFNHGNLRIPVNVDRFIRLLLVTPDMHRVHHSVVPRETNSNFGFCFSWWDRFFGTYSEQPGSGHDLMKIGLKEFRNEADLTFLTLLLIPFRKEMSSYAMNWKKS